MPRVKMSRADHNPWLTKMNEYWYLGLFWSEELVGNDENYLQGHFYDVTISTMTGNKIDKLLMVSSGWCN
jgi:hypothetical protein